MSTRANTLVLVALILLAPMGATAQSTIPGAPSNAPARTTVDVVQKADDISDRIETVRENFDMLANYLREQKIEDSLGKYLNRIGAEPSANQVHIFYVQAYMTDSGAVYLKDYQYLTNGKTGEDALRESFTVEHAPGTEDRLESVPAGQKLVGIYVTATSENSTSFSVRGITMDKEYYQKIRKEGLELRSTRAAARAEALRIADIRMARIAAHAAGEARARENFARDILRGPPRSGVEIEQTGPLRDFNNPVFGSSMIFQPSPTVGPSQAPQFDPLMVPVAHPAIKFDQPPPQPGSVIVNPQD